MEYTGNALSKFILIGEHFVAQEPIRALVFPVQDLTTELSIELFQDNGKKFILKTESFSLEEKLHQSIEVAMEEAFFSALDLLQIDVFSRARGYQITSKTNIPISRGFGSSASFSVALVRALKSMAQDLFQKEISEEEELKTVHHLEKGFHGKPSGIDAAAIFLEVPLVFQKGEVVKTFQNHCLDFILCDSGERKNCKELVQNIGEKREKNPKQWALYTQEIELLSLAAEQGFEQSKTSAVGKAVNECHDILRSLELSTPEIETIRKDALSLGALGAKVSGAGAGGAVVIVSEKNKSEEIAQGLKEMGHNVLTRVLSTGD